MTLQKDYPEIWKAIENQKIPRKEIDQVLLNFILKLCREIKEGSRDELDIGDAFGMGIQNAETAGYKLSPKVEEFLLELGDYKSDPSETGKYDLSDNLANVESRAKSLLQGIGDKEE